MYTAHPQFLIIYSFFFFSKIKCFFDVHLKHGKSTSVGEKKITTHKTTKSTTPPNSTDLGENHDLHVCSQVMILVKFMLPFLTFLGAQSPSGRT